MYVVLPYEIFVVTWKKSCMVRTGHSWRKVKRFEEKPAITLGEEKGSLCVIFHHTNYFYEPRKKNSVVINVQKLI